MHTRAERCGRFHSMSSRLPSPVRRCLDFRFGPGLRYPALGGRERATQSAGWHTRRVPLGRRRQSACGGPFRGGDNQLYVRSWPDMLGETLVSDQDGQLTGAIYPQWSPDGSVLYYQKRNEGFAASVSTDDGFRVTATRKLPFTVSSIRTDGSWLRILWGFRPKKTGMCRVDSWSRQTGSRNCGRGWAAGSNSQVRWGSTPRPLSVGVCPAYHRSSPHTGALCPTSSTPPTSRLSG